MEQNRIRQLYDVQASAFLKDKYPSAAVRIDRLNRAIALLTNNIDKFSEAVASDYGHRHHFQTTVLDAYVSLDALKHSRKNVKAWMKNEHRGAKFPLNLLGAKAYIQHQPVGVVGIIGPWNFPLQLIFSPLANVLAAGNRAMIKPSELTANTSDLLATLISEYFDPSEITVLTGGVETATAFCEQPFDHIVFTGAPSIGKQVMAAAAKNLVPVTLELGGKCPVIAGEGANIADLVDRLMTFKTLNAGQICLAPDTLFIQQQDLDEFILRASQWVKKCFPNLYENEDYTSIINEKHFNRLLNYLADADALGAKIAYLYDDGGYADATLKKLSPALVIDPPQHASICQEEIFGPLLLVKTYDKFTEVLDYMDANERPLALYYFGRNKAEIDSLKYQSISGGLVVNDIASHALQDNMPLGGIGNSGMGSYHGVDGFKRFSHARAVYEQGLFSVDSLFKAPYKESTLKLISKIMG